MSNFEKYLKYYSDRYEYEPFLYNTDILNDFGITLDYDGCKVFTEDDYDRIIAMTYLDKDIPEIYRNRKNYNRIVNDILLGYIQKYNISYRKHFHK